MIDKTPLPGINLNTDEAKTHINNFWSYLDDLAEKNPEEYKNFIQTQMKKGVTQFKTDPNAPSSNNPTATPLPETKKKLEVQPVICLRFKPVKLIKDLEIDYDKDPNEIKIHEEMDIKEVPQIKFASEFQSDAFSNKVIQNRKIYLNVLKSKDYFTPTDEKGNFLQGEAVENENNWKYIPTEFRYNGKKMSMSGTRCDFYDVIIHTLVIGKMKSSEQLYKDILGYIARKFAIFLNDKAELYMKSVKIIEGKMYKSIKSKPEIFDVKANNVSQPRPLPIHKHQQQQQKQAIPVTQADSSPIESKNFYKENKIIIPGTSENYPNTSTFYNLPKENNKAEPKKEKKILIEEIPSKSVNKLLIPLTRKILSNNQMEIKLNFSEFEELKGMKEIDLQISDSGIVIHLDNPAYVIDQTYEPVEMGFDFKVDPDKCKAKYNKTEKVLTVIIEKL